MRRVCDCGRPAVVLARPRKKSSRAVRARRPVAMPGHYLCLQCHRKQTDRERDK